MSIINMNYSELRDYRIVSTGVQASASGKVLVAGGYLILEPVFSGLVMAVSARFHSSVYLLERKSFSATKALSMKKILVFVSAPQRETELMKYELDCEKGDWPMKKLSTTAKNPFVERTLRYTLMLCANLLQTYFWQRLGVSSSSSSSNSSLSATQPAPVLLVCLHGDPQFYSVVPPSPPSSSSSSSRSSSSFVAQKAEMSKTGLGSSAALVSSLVAALFAFFLRDALFPSSSSFSFSSSSSSSSSSAASAFSSFSRFLSLIDPLTASNETLRTYHPETMPSFFVFFAFFFSDCTCSSCTRPILSLCGSRQGGLRL
eukprot:TRINITY_DN996_c0_g1_i1.p1 TRINITY_DN996_c0_g1~~TRINITY_DN996_c0_g1_i1.p1  ORF type:complete len:316 (-),score=93.44 TRINITY_DN996_c0_g1_i1:987-1934(-)